MGKLLHRLGRFSIAWLVAFCLASVLHTQTVLSALTALDIKISITDRLLTVYKDLVGLAPTYGLIILIGLMIAFAVAWLLQKRFSGRATWWFGAAGGVAILAILMAMYPLMNITLLASARTTVGILLQVMAGVCGGLLYGSMRDAQHH
ncbi:MAG: hypothetical protein AAGJ37_12650 [Pseudomonadota bacterium]